MLVKLLKILKSKVLKYLIVLIITIKSILKDGNVVGAVLYGDIDDGSRFYNMMKRVNQQKIIRLYHYLLKVEKRHRYQLLIWLMMKQSVAVMVSIKAR